MDEIDRAAEYEEMHRKAALSRREPVPEHTGYCLNDGCDEPTEGAYCCAECGIDHTRREEAKQRNIKV